MNASQILAAITPIVEALEELGVSTISAGQLQALFMEYSELPLMQILSLASAWNTFGLW